MADEPEFTPITSQEQFDAALKDRLARAEKKAIEPFADYEEIKEKAAKFDQAQHATKTAEQKHADAIAAMQKRLDDADASRAASERAATIARIQAKHGISDDDAALYLTATDDDGIEKQAARLAELAADRRTRAPYVPGQTQQTTAPESAEREFVSRLFGTD